jgi:uncharacterized repeat protein (TIGR01451 family)
MRSRPAWVVVTGALLVLGWGAAPAYAQSPPTISKAFGAAAVALNQSTSLTFTITNPNPATDLTNVSFTDNLPPGLVVANPDSLTPDPVLGDCDPTSTTGAIDATANEISLTGGQIPANATCTFSVDVLAVATGTQVNTTDPITSTEGGTGGTATASVDVFGPPGMTVAFGTSALAPGDSTTLTFTLNNPNTGAMTGLTFDDPLPAGLVVATPSTPSNSCGGTLTADAGATDVNLAAGTLAANAACVAQVRVTAASATGKQDNTIPGASSDQGGQGDHAPSSILLAAHPSASIAFPTSGRLFKLGDAGVSSFSCLEGTGGPGIATCLDQAGHGTGGAIDTSSAGPHTLTVAATSEDGFAGTASVRYQVAAAPSVSITGPSDGARLTYASSAHTGFGCAEGAGGPGLASCLDQSGHASGASIDTRAVGVHTLTVTARSSDGFTATRTITYRVLPNNHFTVSHVKADVNGVVTFQVSVPGAGTLAVSDTASVGHATDAIGATSFASASLHAHHAETVTVKLKPGSSGRRFLVAHPGHVLLRLTVTFTPSGGVARTVTVRGVRVPASPKPKPKPKPKPPPPPIEDLRVH